MKNREEVLRDVMRYATALMAVVYFTLGLGVLLRGRESFQLSSVQAQLLGVLLIAYAGFRGYRVYKQFTEKQNADEKVDLDAEHS